MGDDSFDQYSMKYDAWFLKNRNVLYSEARLLARFLEPEKKILSVGCGSGLFEMVLKKEFNITVSHGIEPARAMAEIARKRGMDVEVQTAEGADLGSGLWDIVIFNGSPGYIGDLGKAFRKAYAALVPGGRVVVLDVPKESSYAMLYTLAATLGTWDHERLAGIQPVDPYPIEFVSTALWRTTGEKVSLLEKAGFTNFEFAQTLTRHPVYSNQEIEVPVPGYDRGDYVAIKAVKEPSRDNR